MTTGGRVVAVILFVLSVAATAPAELTIDVALVVTPESEKTPSRLPEELEKEVPGKLRECSECKPVEVVTPDGRRLHVLAEPAPRVHLAAADVDHFEIGPDRASSRGPVIWGVRAHAKPEPAAHLDTIRREHPLDRALVSLDGKPSEVCETADWVGGIRVNAFSTEEEAFAFARENGLPMPYATPDELRTYERKTAQDSIKRANKTIREMFPEPPSDDPNSR